VVGALTVGCHAVKYSEHKYTAGTVTTLTYDATRRAIKIIPKESSDSNARALIIAHLAQLNALEDRIKALRATKPIDQWELDKKLEERTSESKCLEAVSLVAVRPIILAEPPPDAVSTLAAELSGKLGNASISKFSASETIRLSEISSANHAIRDALYRLNEAAVMEPSILTNGTYSNLFTAIMTTAAKMNRSNSATNLPPSSSDGKAKRP
jgi:hypothetical protein